MFGSRPSWYDFLATPFLLAILAALVAYDLKQRRLPDRFTLPLVLAGLLLSFFRTPSSSLDASLGAATGFALFAILGAAFHRRFGVEGLGGGDAKLLAAAGAWLGWQPLAFVILIASAGTLAVVLLSRSKRRDIAFGPGLALSFALVWMAFLTT